MSAEVLGGIMLVLVIVVLGSFLWGVFESLGSAFGLWLRSRVHGGLGKKGTGMAGKVERIALRRVIDLRIEIDRLEAALCEANEKHKSELTTANRRVEDLTAELLATKKLVVILRGDLEVEVKP